MKCLQCNKKTTNPKFCSRSCAATYNNTKKPKRQVEGKCYRCNKPCTKDRTYCRPCWEQILSEKSTKNWTCLTLGELKGSGNANLRGRYPYIRNLSRKAYIKSGKPMACYVCGYDKHVDICHIKPVNSFDLTATVDEINDLKNLTALCKNHHWELDNGHLKLEEKSYSGIG